MVSDRSVYVRIKADVNDFNRGMMSASAAAKAFHNELDTSTDRTAMFVQGIMAIAPATVPIAAAVVPAISGMTNQLAFAAAGAGVAVLAFQGVGDALKATNEYAIKPTDANLAKMRETMSSLGPAGRDLVDFLQSVRPEMQGLQDVAQAGLFPGVEDGIRDLMTRLPEVERIIGIIADTSGGLIAEAGQNLAGPKWDEFFSFLESEARPTLVSLGRSIGNVTEGFANLWMAFDPLSDDFSRSFLQMSRDFATWTDGLDQTQGFQDFVDYIQNVGPEAWQTLGALGNALLQIVEAAAPVGQAALPAIEGVSNAIAAIADSDIGPAVIGIASLTAAYSRLISLSTTANSSAIGGIFSRSAYAGTASALKDLPRAVLQYDGAASRAQASVGQLAASTGRLGTALRGTAKLAGGAGGLAFVMSDLDSKMGLSNTAMLGLAGTMLGPWGGAVGASVGLAKDFAASNDEVWSALDRTGKMLENNTAPIQDQLAALQDAGDKVGELAESSDRLGIAWVKNGVEDLFGKSDVDEATDAWMKAADQYDVNAQKARDLRLAEAGLSESLSGTTEATRDQVDAVLKLIDARNELANEALTALDAELAYEAALDKAAETAKKGKDGLDSNTEVGRENLGVLSDLAKAWNDLSPAQQNAEGASERARRAFMQAADGMGANKKRAKELADQYLEMPTSVVTNVRLTGAAAAADQANALTVALNNIPGLTETTIRTIKETYNVPKGSKSDPKPSLKDMLTPYTGMRMPQGYASGGVVPGTPPADPTEDNVLAMGATTGRPLIVRSGEWIINQRQSEKNDPWLKAINNGLVLDDLFNRASIPGFASGGRYDDYSDLTQSSRLDIERQKLQIQEMRQSLRETETVGKGKSKRRRKRLRGRAKTVAELELKDAKAELQQMLRENRELKKYGTPKQEEALRDEAEKMADLATERISIKKSAAQKFDIFSGGSAAAVDRNLARVLANSQEFLGLLGTLKAKGMSPWVLEQFVEAGPTGGAIRLAREYATSQDAFNSINARASQIDQYTNRYAGLVGSANFMNPGAWNSGISMQPQAPMVASIVGAKVEMGADGFANFVQGQIVVSLDGQAQEARFAPL